MARETRSDTAATIKTSDPVRLGESLAPGTRVDETEHETHQAGADGERERVEGTSAPEADTIPAEAGAGDGTTAGPQR